MSKAMPVRSDRCGLDELFLSYETGDAERARLALGPGWTRQWTATWQVPGGDEVSLVRDLGPAPVAGCEPVRRFSWGRRQRHRPGLQFMVSTGRVHGFESLEEQSLLLALDFTGALEDVLPQPFTLRFGTADSGFLKHVPDFLAVFRDGSRWLLDVRPARLVREDDATCFAAAAEAALEAGWRYSVVAGWRPHVRTGIDALSAQRRDLQDRLGLQERLLEAVSARAGRVRGPGRGDAAAGGRPGACAAPAVAQAAGDRPVPPALRRVAGLAGRGERLMAGQAGLLELSAGSVLLLGGREWTVSSVEPQYGRVLLRAGGEERRRSIRWLAHHPDCRPVPDDDAAVPARQAGQPPALGDLTDYQREVVRLRVAHLLEAETGFRSGDPLHPEPGEPRPAYDPRTTMLGQRRRAKAAELNALGGEEAALLGLGSVSERTLRRMADAWKDRGPAGCIDGRWLRPRAGHPSITEEVREAIFAVRKETRDRSRTSMKDKHVLVAQYVAEKFGADVPVPGYWTLKKAWREWFGPGGTRPRYDRSADGIEAAKVHVTVHRPGQVVALDTTPLPVKVRDGVFGDPVSAHLTLALDMFTHSAVAFRLTLVSDTAVDIAMLLRDIMMPLPMRDGWGPEMEWPYPGVPAGIVADFAGHRVAGLPFFAPETVTTDHGGPYKSRTAVAAQQALGCNILPARVLRPQDKAACERAFGSLRSLLFEHLPGYTGIDVADRGADPEADAMLTMDANGTSGSGMDYSPCLPTGEPELLL